jgi:hypothetical protein
LRSCTIIPRLCRRILKKRSFDQVLGYHAIKLGVGRHVGRLSELYTPAGLVWIQDGKDLSKVARVIGTGGVLINSQGSADDAGRRGTKGGCTPGAEAREPLLFLGR